MKADFLIKNNSVITDLRLLYYGSERGGFNYKSFISLLKYFKVLDSELIHECSHKEDFWSDLLCTKQISNELEKTDSTTIVLILNYETSIISCSAEEVLDVMKVKENQIIVAPRQDKYGLNLIGQRDTIQNYLASKTPREYNDLQQDVFLELKRNVSGIHLKKENPLLLYLRKPNHDLRLSSCYFRFKLLIVF